jgi:hypothetical protein
LFRVASCGLRVACCVFSIFQYSTRNAQLETRNTQVPKPLTIKAMTLVLKTAILNRRRIAASSTVDSIRCF